MKNLGKIALFFLIPHAIFAGVVASVDSKSVELGEMVTYSLDLSGENIERPDISTLCGTDIVSTSSSTSINMINGNYKKSFILSYKFVPQTSCEIEALDIKIDGQTEKTQPIKIEVKAVSQAKDSDFALSLESDKKELFVGEPFELTLLFKQRRDAEAVDSKFAAPDLKGFWVKEESKPIRYNDGDYTITKVTYKIAPQREGTQKISRAQMSIASRANTRDTWGSWVQNIKWRNYFSNELELNIKPLPSGVSLIGDFTLNATADKSEINANEAVNVTIEVEGEGNLEDIKTFKPYIDKVNVFDEKIVIENSKLSQKMAFVADEYFTIAPFELKFFNPKTQEIQTLSTKEIQIKVKNATPKKELTIKREESPKIAETHSSDKEINNYWTLLGFIGGLACGILLMLLKPWKFFRREKSVSLKDPKILLMKLLPFKNDEEVQKILDILEQKIYSNSDIKLEKKLINELMKKYNIK